MSSEEDKSNSNMKAAELRARNNPVLDGKAADFSAYTFWQYTNVNSIGKILSGNCFWVNNICGMNDVHEAELHGAEKEDVFLQCFCNSNSEKIPMWYLYGGIVGRGASIGFTPAVMMNYIKSIQYVTELIPDPASPSGYSSGEQLKIDEDVELQTGWVFYADDKRVDDAGVDDHPVRVNYRNEFFNIDSAAEFYPHNYFVKDYPWEYEKEFRLVFINRTGRKIQKIKVDIPAEFREKRNRKIRIRLAPEVSSSDLDEYARRLREVGKDYQLLIDKSGLKINMDLLGRNRNDINERVLADPAYLKEDVQKRVYEFYEKCVLSLKH